MTYAVILKGYERCIPKEAVADGAIDPGQGVAFESDGKIGAGDGPVLRVAYNDDYRAIDDEYEDGEQTKYVTPPKGVELYVPVTDDSLAYDTVLEVNNDGNFAPHDTGEAVAVVVPSHDSEEPMEGRLFVEVI